MSTIRLTALTQGGGCGCKISPVILKRMLLSVESQSRNPNLIVGFESSDDAAAYALDDAITVLSTADFFTPIVDDPYDYGAIAAANALSDIYAMGGSPLMALALLGWPVNDLDPASAGDVLRGASSTCSAAGVSLAGGHSIESPEPIFGLAVTGVCDRAQLLTNAGAVPGSELYLTKPLGIGILCTAHKRGLLSPDDLTRVKDVMLMLNDLGPAVARLGLATGMTDVTGFGLLGHLIELCEASGVTAKIHYDQVPVFESLPRYRGLGAVPGGTQRNYQSYRDRVGRITEEQMVVLCDPQTSGGLLLAIEPTNRDNFLALASSRGMVLQSIGVLLPGGEGPLVEVL